MVAPNQAREPTAAKVPTIGELGAALKKVPPMGCWFCGGTLFAILMQLRIAQAVPGNVGASAKVIEAFLQKVQGHLPQEALDAALCGRAWAADRCSPAWPPSLN